MEAVTSAGKKRYAARASLVLALASGLSPALAASPVDEIERLMREQRALHTSQSQQIQSLRQQLDSQAVTNQAQDWQLTGGLAGVLLLALMGAWLLARWPHWQQQSQTRQAQRKRQAKQREKHSLPPEQLDAAFVASGLQSGADIDHSGQGMVKRLVQQKKRSQQKISQGMSEPTPDSEWLAQLDELDSQFLAEDALREYELRKAVGLISEDDHRLQAAAAQQSQAAGVDDVWHSMEEVPLVSDDEEAAKLEAAKPELAHVDVSMEVQRVRKALHERRKTRHLQALTITESAAQESEQELDFQVCMAEPVAQTELAHTQFDTVIAAEKPAEVCHEIAEVAAEPNAEMVLSYVQEHADRFSPSVRAMSDAETRLALAKEFEKLGQLDEAAQMCEEVLQSGSPEEQAKAQHYLRQLPGR